MKTIRQSITFLILAFLSVCGIHAAADELSINNLDSQISITLTSSDINAGTVNSGDIDFCVVAKENDTNRNNFSLSVEQAASSNNQFILFNGSHEIPFTLKIGSYYNKDDQVMGLDTLETVSPNATTQHQYKGGLSCADGNYGKSRITFSLSIQQDTLVSGTYTANLVVRARSGSLVSSEPLAIHLTVNSLVKVSRLNDITLTRHASLGYYGGSDDFCAYSTTGGFLISAQGQPSDSNDFLLHKGATTLPYKVILGRNDHLGGTFDVTPGQKVDIHATPANCLITDNAQVSVAVIESVANASESGVYTGTVYLQVEPQ